MKFKSSIIFYSALAAACMILLVSNVQAGTAPDRLEGRVHMISTDGSMLTLHVSPTPGNSTMKRLVALNGKTQFTFQNQPGSIDQLKEGLRVICVGKFDENGKLIADRIDVRKRQ